MAPTTGERERPRIGIDLRPLTESRTFRFLWISSVISGVGTRFTTIAMVWQVKEITDGDAGKLALIGLCYAVPLLLLSVFGGAFADKRDRRTIMVGASAVGLLTALVLAANASAGSPRLWVVYVVAVCNACQMAMAGPAEIGEIANPDGEIIDMARHRIDTQSARARLPAPVGRGDTPAAGVPVAQRFEIFLIGIAPPRHEQQRSAQPPRIEATRAPVDAADGVAIARLPGAFTRFARDRATVDRTSNSGSLAQLVETHVTNSLRRALVTIW